MSAPIPLRRDFDASQLRGFARKTKDGPQARRLLALAALYDGGTRTEAAKIGGVGLQIIRDWVCDTIEIWFADEARIGQKNKITRRWAKRGTRPSAPRDQRTAPPTSSAQSAPRRARARP